MKPTPWSSRAHWETDHSTVNEATRQSEWSSRDPGHLLEQRLLVLRGGVRGRVGWKAGEDSDMQKRGNEWHSEQSPRGLHGAPKGV